jgi:hypothetical protein
MSSLPPRKRASGPSGAKILASAGALVATLAGWAAISLKQAGPAAAATPDLSATDAQLAASGVLLQPLPTLVPASAMTVTDGSAAPQPFKPTAVLRSVSRPPAPKPIVVTRSSRR